MSAQQVTLSPKTKVMMLNVPNPSPVKVNGEDIPTTEEFTYLGSTIRHDAEQATTSGIVSTRPGKATE